MVRPTKPAPRPPPAAVQDPDACAPLPGELGGSEGEAPWRGGRLGEQTLSGEEQEGVRHGRRWGARLVKGRGSVRRCSSRFGLDRGAAGKGTTCPVPPGAGDGLMSVFPKWRTSCEGGAAGPQTSARGARWAGGRGAQLAERESSGGWGGGPAHRAWLRSQFCCLFVEECSSTKNVPSEVSPGP